jgi:hypothetical protein
MIKSIATMLMNNQVDCCSALKCTYDHGKDRINRMQEVCMHESAKPSQQPIVKRQSGRPLQSIMKHVCSTQLQNSSQRHNTDEIAGNDACTNEPSISLIATMLMNTSD